MTDSRHPWERWVDIGVFAPIGVITSLREDLPRYVRQGRQAIENRIVLARWIGQMAVQHGRRQIELELAASNGAAHHEDEQVEHDEPLPVTSHSDPEPETESAVEPAVEPAAEPVVEPVSEDLTADLDADLEADALPIEGYESLAALHVVQRLAGLSAGELEAVRRFELSHRGRRTILAKVAQLQTDGV